MSALYEAADLVDYLEGPWGNNHAADGLGICIEQLESYRDRVHSLSAAEEAGILAEVEASLLDPMRYRESDGSGGDYALAMLLGRARSEIEYLHSTLPGVKMLLKEEPVLSTPTLEIVQLAASELVRVLGPHPQEWASLGSRRFEEVIAEIWSGLGWETLLTPPVRDGGFDIRAIRNEHGVCLCYFIECKAFNPSRALRLSGI